MIGDLLSNLATAQKLDISQIQKAIQDGTLPAYVGVPLLQQKLQQRQEAAALLAGRQQQGQPPIAQQVMQAADQVTQPMAAAAPQGIEQALQQAQPQQEQGIDTAQSNMPQQFAGGGIVAFADGDLVDDESDAEKEDKALFSRLLGNISMPKSYEESLAEKGYTPRQLRDLVRKVRKDDLGNYVAPPEGIAAAPVVGRKLDMQGHPFHNEVVKYSKQIGLDPEVGLKVLYTETGGMRDPAHAKSKAGAYGPMQLMEATAKDIGVNRRNPIQNVHGGLDYLKQQVDAFGDPKLAAAAYNAGPGAVRRALASGMGIDALPMETRQYAANFKDGGIVAFDDGGTVYDPVTGLPVSGEETYIPKPATRLPPTKFFMDPEWKQKQAEKEAEAILKQKPAAPTAPTAPTAPDQTVADVIGSKMAGDQFAVGKDIYTPRLEDKTLAKEAPDEGLADIRSMIKESMAENKKQKEIDAWMSLLSAGIGGLQAAGDIRPGKVHTPFGDLATGFQQGIGYYAQAGRARADEAKSLLSAQLGLSRADLYEKLRRDALKQRAEENLAGRALKAQQLTLQGQAQRIKLGDLMRKAAIDWDGSKDEAKVVADLKKRYGSNWERDFKANAEYKAEKNKFINQFVNVGQADDVLSADYYLKQT